jgi:hypothetical protein
MRWALLCGAAQEICFRPTIDNLLYFLHSQIQVLLRWTITKAHMIDALAFRYVSDPSRIHIKKDTRNTNHLFTAAFLKEHQAVILFVWQSDLFQ